MAVLLTGFFCFVLALAAVMLLATRIKFQRPAVSTFVAVSALLVIVRLGAFWFLTYLEWTHQQTLSALPLVFLMLPEAFVFPDGHTLNATSAVLFTLLLTAGSCTMGGIAAGLVAATQKVRDE
jgi:hypothetical protein